MAMSVVYGNFCGMLVHENRGGVQADFVADTLGSVAAIVDSTGTSVYSAEYWPYGEVRTELGTNPSNWSFVGLQGYFRDILSKLLYVRARHLKPDTGQWLTSDPLWPDEAPYAYVRSMPLMVADPDGLDGDRCESWADNGNVNTYLGPPNNHGDPVDSGPCYISGGGGDIQSEIEVEIGLGIAKLKIHMPLDCKDIKACTCKYQKFKAKYNRYTQVCQCKRPWPHGPVYCSWSRPVADSNCTGYATKITVDCFTSPPATSWLFYSPNDPGCSGSQGVGLP